MENATKALIMAGGLLIAILVLGLLVVGYRNISDYQQSATNLKKDQQLSTFNNGFTQYVRDDLVGTDVISLVNKVFDYNQKTGGVGEIDYSYKITLKINMHNFKDKYLTNYITQSSYTINQDSTEYDGFLKLIKQMRKLEDDYGREELRELYSNIESLKTYYDEGDTTNGLSIKDVIGKNIPALATQFSNGDFSSLEKHTEYTEFKTSTFAIKSEPTYHNENGQIKSMVVDFVK